MDSGVRCSRCGEAGTVVIVEVAAVTLYLDLCEAHLADLLRGAREVGGRTQLTTLP